MIVRLEISTRRRDGARYGIGPVDRARHIQAAVEHEGWAKERRGGTGAAGKVSEDGRGRGREGSCSEERDRLDECKKSDEKERNYGCASEHYECSYIGVGVT